MATYPSLSGVIREPVVKANSCPYCPCDEFLSLVDRQITYSGKTANLIRHCERYHSKAMSAPAHCPFRACTNANDYRTATRLKNHLHLRHGVVLEKQKRHFMCSAASKRFLGE